MSRTIFKVSKKDLGQNIRRLREDVLRMKKQQELASRLDVAAYTVGNWENGRSFPDAAEMLAMLALCRPEDAQQFILDISKLGEQNPPPETSLPERLRKGPPMPRPSAADKQAEGRHGVFHEPLSPRIPKRRG
jgi:transcriptional regulator with XRE-family HTH domain